MKMSGEEIIPASVETVWRALNDINVLKACIPGCETITKTSEHEMTARVVVKIGPVKAGFNGNVHLKNLNPPHSYRIEGKGDGGMAGQASGGANVRLEAVEGGTKLSYDVDAQVGGKMAMLGSRLIDSAASSLAGQFFDKFAKVAGSLKTTSTPMAPKTGSAKKTVKKAPAKAAKKAVKKVAKKPAAKKPAAKKPAKKAAKKKR